VALALLWPLYANATRGWQAPACWGYHTRCAEGTFARELAMALTSAMTCASVSTRVFEQDEDDSTQHLAVELPEPFTRKEGWLIRAGRGYGCAGLLALAAGS
jgi:hypothetical protein